VHTTPEENTMNDTAAGPPSGPPTGPPTGPQWQPNQPGQPSTTGWQPGQQQIGPGGAPAMSPESERNWAMGAHLSAFAAAYLALGFLGPLIMMLTVGNRSPFVRRHAVEALNFNLSWLLYIVVAGILVWLLVGIPLLILLGVAYLVLVVLAAIEASGGREYRYPLTIRIVS
jgi:uncharacterized protein